MLPPFPGLFLIRLFQRNPICLLLCPKCKKTFCLSQGGKKCFQNTLQILLPCNSLLQSHRGCFNLNFCQCLGPSQAHPSLNAGGYWRVGDEWWVLGKEDQLVGLAQTLISATECQGLWRYALSGLVYSSAFYCPMVANASLCHGCEHCRTGS